MQNPCYIPFFSLGNKFFHIYFLIIFAFYDYLILLIHLLITALPFFWSAKLSLNSKIVFMKGYTYDKSLSEKEEQILSLVYSGNEHYLNTFNFVHKFYRINYRLHKSNHLSVFKTVYIKKSKLPAWKLASSCNIAQSTLFRLRNEIVECFHTCLEDEQNTLKEIAVTMD